jgi:hypothetical protein
MPYATRIEKFLVEAYLLNGDSDSSVDISRYVTDINVRKDYAQSSFPLVVVNFMITEQLRDTMQGNDVSIRLKVSKYVDVNQDTTQADSIVSVDEVVFDTVIRSYQKPFSSTMSRTEEDNESGDNQRDTIQLTPYQIAGIPDDLISKNRLVVNEVYEDARIDDVLVNILSSVEQRRIFVDPSDNVERERSLIIPPMNLVPAIKYLQEVYGVYDAGMSLFFDFDGTYLTKLLAQSRVYSNTLEVITVPPNDNDADIRYSSNQIDEAGNVRLNMKVPPPYVSNDKINLDYVGQTTVFNSYDFNFEPVRRIYNQETNNDKTRYFWNRYQNKIFEQSYINEAIRSSEAIMINLKNISPSYFRQNTLYKVSSDRQYATGEYNLIEMSFSIYTRGDYTNYESMVSLKLSKKQ